MPPFPDPLPGTTRLHDPASIGSAAADRSLLHLLYTAVLLVACLFAFEIAHYLRATDYGNLDEFAQAWIGYHPQCSPATAGALDMTCPVAAYNSVGVHCWGSSCEYRDPNDLPLTEAMRKRRERQLKEDVRNSHAVEPPIPVSERAAVVSEDALPPRPQTMPAAWEYVYYRDMQQRHLLLKKLER